MASRTSNRAAGRAMALPVPGDFNFERTVLSHGWYDLPPFSWDGRTGSLTRSLRLPDGASGLARVTSSGRNGSRALRVRLSADRPVTRADALAAARVIGHVFRLDEDLGIFYRRAVEVQRPDLRWTSAAGAGRLLRAPTVFEDLIKMICTTNCTWALTRVMVSGLVDRLGPAAPEGARLFPEAPAMAAKPARFYRDVIRAGYRGAFLRGLARRVADGQIDPESWNDATRPTGEIRDQILSIDGAGPYVADNMLKLLGRYDGLGIDSWCRRKFSQMYHGGRAVGDRRIQRFYEPFGPYRGLALWCDITRDWFDGDVARVPTP